MMTRINPRSARDLARVAGKAVPALAALSLLGAVGSASGQESGTPIASPAQPPAPAAQAPRRGNGQPPSVQVSEHETVTLNVKDDDLTTVLELLSIQSGRNIVASKSVTGKVTAHLTDVTFKDALDALLHVNGYGYIEDGNFIYVYTIDELQKIEEATRKRIARVVRLNYLNATDAYEFVRPLVSQGGDIKMSTKAGTFNIPTDTPVGAEDYALGSTLVIFDYEQNIEAITQLLTELDTKPAQVLVEATVLQTALNEANAFGVDFSLIGDLEFTDFVSAGGPRRVADALVAGGSGGGGQGVSPADNMGRALQSTPGNTDGRSTFKIGVVNDDFSVFLKMLDEVSDTTILSNPKILALNRMPARVLVGRRVGYLNTTSTDTATTQTVEFLDTGTQLYFRPFVSADGTIRMELKPQVSEAIIREATDATGAAVSIPDEVTQELTTNVLVRDGQTIVLGGLFRESTQLNRRQVPLLGDVPLIGAAFRGHDDTTQRSEIIFMITPTIVTDSTMADAAKRAMDDAERLRAGSRQGLLPWSRERMTAAMNVEAEAHARAGNYDKAMWNIQRSLALNPLQSDALRLRERITGMREIWPSRSVLDNALSAELRRRNDMVKPAPGPVPHSKPYGAENIPQWPVDEFRDPEAFAPTILTPVPMGVPEFAMNVEPGTETRTLDPKYAANPWIYRAPRPVAARTGFFDFDPSFWSMPEMAGTEDETDDGATGTTELAGTPGPSATTGGAEAALPEAPADEPLAGAFVSGKPVSSGPRAPESAAADSATSGTAGPTGAIAGGVSAPADDFFSKPKGQSGWFGQGKFFLARLVGRGGSAPVVSVPTETDSSPAK